MPTSSPPLLQSTSAGEAIDGGGRVMVHCTLGVSRSTTSVAAFLMRYKKWTLRETLTFIADKRQGIKYVGVRPLPSTFPAFVLSASRNSSPPDESPTHLPPCEDLTAAFLSSSASGRSASSARRKLTWTIFFKPYFNEKQLDSLSFHSRQRDSAFQAALQAAFQANYLALASGHPIIHYFPPQLFPS
jgi:hypothetical protein